MKKIALFLLLVTSVTLAIGQKSVRQTASNYLKDGKLDKALEAINQCIVDPGTSQDCKTWFLRGNIYMEIANAKDEKYRSLESNPLPKALDSYKKCLEFDPKKEMAKKEYYGDIFFRISKQHLVFFDSAVSKYNKKNYKEAMLSFGYSADVMEAVGITDTLSLMNGAICAASANEKDAQKIFLQRLIKSNYRSPSVYSDLSDIYLKQKDSSNAFKYIRMGLKEFPNNRALFNSEINIYLTYNIIDKAMSNLNIAMKNDTTNYSIPFALGTLYDNIANDTLKSAAQKDEAFSMAAKSYTRALQIKPDYVDAAFNLGALNLNKASDILVKANNLPPDAVAEFTKRKKEADSYLEKAMPNFERALELQPTDLNTLNALRQIYTRLGLVDKKKAIQEKINALQKK